MHNIKRQLWWYSLAVPLRVKSLAYRYLPLNRTENIPIGSVLAEQPQPNFQPYYFSYGYYPTSIAFEKSMGMTRSPSMFKIKRQKGNEFNPILVVLDALTSYNQYHNHQSDAAFHQFHQACNFLEDYALKNHHGVWIPYYQDYPKYGMKAPWVSGLTQALTLSIFLRKKPVDIDFLKGLFQSLWFPVEEGGVLTKHPSGYPWIAEYPGDDVPYVLNGQLSVMIGLLEYLAIYPDKKVKEVVVQMINGFFSDYNAYFFNNSMKYCWTKSKLASIHYRGLHAFQLVHLYQLTRLVQFKKLAKEWIPKVHWKDFARFHYLLKDGSEFQDELLSEIQP